MLSLTAQMDFYPAFNTITCVFTIMLVPLFLFVKEKFDPNQKKLKSQKRALKATLSLNPDEIDPNSSDIFVRVRDDEVVEI